MAYEPEPHYAVRQFGMETILAMEPSRVDISFTDSAATKMVTVVIAGTFMLMFRPPAADRSTRLCAH